ncbi:hypothetical protein DYB25_000931 [Aphanomyces astaci]|uniref:HSF-type DNA-binding domain-containing protein n=1 Tax=Aphanomyces astaci TaxID=112090 RepID=A0A397CWP0_APHAT|nr:hypothetical protein DYB25_000931 [Aphanomyces astaci]RHY06823.1 hypothetical protein DYB36_000217 [Aphanomyces astaci]RHY51408.1 hypothetical protein DYB30_000607 [Aphanomyces astaci]RHY56791.1 hypothetical protein DYB34_003879 [Aphanomyces astaci]RHY58518.1 hypothetical protein DYB38_000869 [Aphanomyces astaci]
MALDPAPLAAVDAVPSFVQSLHSMLQLEDATIIRWTPDGHAFEILDQRLLAARILHRYFRHTKYASFQRQLNYFGFRKWPKQKAAICTYSQLHFSRDNPADLHRIKRRVKAGANEPIIHTAAAAVDDDTRIPVSVSTSTQSTLATCIPLLKHISTMASSHTMMPEPDGMSSSGHGLVNAEPPQEHASPQMLPPSSPCMDEAPMSWHSALWSSTWLSDFDPQEVERGMGDVRLWLDSL